MCNIELDININIKAIYTTETEEINIISSIPVVRRQEYIPAIQWVAHILNKTEATFSILCIGVKNLVGKRIPLGEPITVKFIEGDIVLEQKVVTSHKSIRARLDGLSSMFKNKGLEEGSKLLLRYIAETKELEIKKA